MILFLCSNQIFYLSLTLYKCIYIFFESLVNFVHWRRQTALHSCSFWYSSSLLQPFQCSLAKKIRRKKKGTKKLLLSDQKTFILSKPFVFILFFHHFHFFFLFCFLISLLRSGVLWDLDVIMHNKFIMLVRCGKQLFGHVPSFKIFFCSFSSAPCRLRSSFHFLPNILLYLSLPFFFFLPHFCFLPFITSPFSSHRFTSFLRTLENRIGIE